MLVKTSDLTGAALDWAVAKCEGVLERIEIEQVNGAWAVAVPDLGCYFEPSTDWAQGGPIKEKYQISTTYCNGHVEATVRGYYGQGSTELIAAMRCYVDSKLGDTVEIPDELML